MCIIYPLGIPLLFGFLMRRERRNMAAKARSAARSQQSCGFLSRR
jgi:hypothetical protein